MSTIRAERSEAVGAGMPPTFRRLLVNTLVTGVTSTFLWFALTFWVYLETRSVVATGVIGGAFNISSAVLGPFFGADLIGSWFGTGPDRGIALMFTLAGLVGVAVTARAWTSRSCGRLAAACDNCAA